MISFSLNIFSLLNQCLDFFFRRPFARMIIMCFLRQTWLWKKWQSKPGSFTNYFSIWLLALRWSPLPLQNFKDCCCVNTIITTTTRLVLPALKPLSGIRYHHNGKMHIQKVSPKANSVAITCVWIKTVLFSLFSSINWCPLRERESLVWDADEYPLIIESAYFPFSCAIACQYLRLKHLASFFLELSLRFWSNKEKQIE